MYIDQFEIIKAFSSGIKVELTINQICKIIKKSYAFTNKYVHALAEEGIILKRAIGPSILCTLDMTSERTIACLTYLSIEKASVFLNDSKLNIAANLKEGIVAYVKQNKLHVFSESGGSVEVEKLKVISHHLSELAGEISGLDLTHIYIVKGHEAFWRIASKVA
ncbi:MAG: hypothetical protein ABIJ34_03055 [archaeon]